MREIAFVFTGKSGLQHEVHAEDRRLAVSPRNARRSPGNGCSSTSTTTAAPRPSHSHDVNEYLRDAADGDFTAKDFRTWVATVIAAGTLGRLEPPESERAEQAAVREVVADVAEELGNTPAVAGASYIHPQVLTSFRTGDLAEAWSVTPPRRARLTLDERRTRALLAVRSKRRAATASRPDEAQRRAG